MRRFFFLFLNFLVDDDGCHGATKKGFFFWGYVGQIGICSGGFTEGGCPTPMGRWVGGPTGTMGGGVGGDGVGGVIVGVGALVIGRVVGTKVVGIAVGTAVGGSVVGASVGGSVAAVAKGIKASPMASPIRI